MPLSPAIAHQSLKEAVLERLRHGIVEGLCRPGTHLVEQALATEMGVSRGPVREALAQLEQEGLVSILPRRGAVVTELSLRQAWEMYTLRGHLEGLAARFAHDHWTPGHSARMKQVLARMATLGPADWLPAVELDREFHGLILEASQNHTLIQVYRSMDTQVVACFLAVKRRLNTVPTQMAARHGALAEALLNGDFHRAEILAMEHWSSTAYRFRSLMQIDPSGTEEEQRCL
jgi:DNA-binding GntR family transcriptional regulator